MVEHELQSHLRTCPMRLRAAKEAAQPFFRLSCNTGPGGPVVPSAADSAAPLAAQRAAYANSIGAEALIKLIGRVEDACAKVRAADWYD